MSEQCVLAFLLKGMMFSGYAVAFRFLFMGLSLFKICRNVWYASVDNPISDMRVREHSSPCMNVNTLKVTEVTFSQNLGLSANETYHL